MKIKLSFMLIVVLIANLLLSGVASAQSAPTEVYVSPVITATTTCGEMTFGVWVKNVVAMTAFHLEIGFNTGSVEVTKVVNGGFLGAPTESALFEPTNGIYNGTGKILFGVAQQGTNGNPTPRNGTGKLIEITLKAKAPGNLVPFTIDGSKSILVNWPDALPIPFIVTGPGVVGTSSCAPTNITLSPNSIENGEPAGTEVGKLTTTDPDSSFLWESWTYSLPASYGDNALFAISGDKVSTRFTADYGSRTSYMILVRSTDAGGKYFEKPFTINVTDAIAPTMTAMVAIGAGSYGDVTAVGTTFTVVQGYTVAAINITMSEPVTVVTGTKVTLNAVPYGAVTVSPNGLTLIVTPYAGNEVASKLGAFMFGIPAGSVKDLAGNALTTLSATLNVTNQVPVAINDAYSVDEDKVLNVPTRGVLANDTDFDPFILTAELVGGPNHGSLTLNTDGSFTYTPTANYNGSDTFTYKANDGTANSNTATVTITVTAVNDAPVVQGQSLTTTEDTAVGITPLATDVDDDPLTYIIKTLPDHGTAEVVAGVINYTPGLNYNGPDSFTFVAKDASLESNTATVNITVSSVNNTPVANAQTVTTAEDTAVAITPVATDVDGDTLTYIIKTLPAHGTAGVVAGVINYTPGLNYNGPDSFTFVAKDASLESTAATVSITVTAVNDPSVANAQSVTTAEDTAVAITLTGTDPDGDTLTYEVVDAPQHGSLTGTAPNLTYTPALNYAGLDSFTFKGKDATVYSEPATISIMVTAVNDAPVANAQSVTTAEDTAVAITLVATDVDGDTLMYIIKTSPAHGTAGVIAGVVNYTPALNYYGPDSFTFVAKDASLESNIATVSITVTAVNDAPVADAKTITTAEDTAVAITLVATDVDGDALTYSIVAEPAHGAVSGTAPALTYTPAANYSGPDSFSFKVKDALLESNIATVSITVITVNDAPVAVDDFYETKQDTTLVITEADGVLKNDTDIDLNTMTVTSLSGTTHGTLNLKGDGSFTYIPASGFFGTDTFTYQLVTYPSLADAGGWTDEAVVTVTVNPAPPPGPGNTVFLYLPIISR